MQTEHPVYHTGWMMGVHLQSCSEPAWFGVLWGAVGYFGVLWSAVGWSHWQPMCSPTALASPSPGAGQGCSGQPPFTPVPSVSSPSPQFLPSAPPHPISHVSRCPLVSTWRPGQSAPRCPCCGCGGFPVTPAAPSSQVFGVVTVITQYAQGHGISIKL